MGYVELTKYKTEDATILAYLEQVLKACNRARTWSPRFSRSAASGKRRRKPVAVTPIVKEAMKLLRSSVPATVDIRQSYVNGNDTVLADPTQVHQVLMNLCTNAVHAMGRGRRSCGASRPVRRSRPASPAYDLELKAGAYLELTVSDTGKGIDPAVKDKIFDPFFTTKKPGEGTGLGLSVVYGIVKDHGGVITMESEPGRRDNIYGFAAADRDRPAAGDHESTIIPKGSGSILLVDDEEPIASLGQEMLTSLGYDVSVRFSSIEAL